MYLLQALVIEFVSFAIEFVSLAIAFVTYSSIWYENSSIENDQKFVATRLAVAVNMIQNVQDLVHVELY